MCPFCFDFALDILWFCDSLQSAKAVFFDKATSVSKIGPKIQENLQEESLSILMLSAKPHSCPVLTFF